MTALTEQNLKNVLTYKRILRFWLPLAGTWFMMAVEGPYLAAIMARLPDATVNLAAFGVAFAFAIIIESPVIMLMSASTALVEDGPSYLALRRFSYGLAILLTGIQLVVLMPSVFTGISQLLALPPDVSQLTHGSLTLLLPWPAAIAYRRFRQGLLITQNLTHWVAYGTVIRLVSMSTTAFIAFRFSALAGAYIGALALSVAVVVEAITSRVMTRQIVPKLLKQPRQPERMATLTLPALIRFYVPLALTSFIALAIQPIVTFFMGQARFALESLAVLPVIHGLTFIFRSIGLSYLEVTIALLGQRREHFEKLRNFAYGLAVISAVGLSAIAFTPLSVIWFHDISGLTMSLTTVATLPIQILACFPVMSVALHFMRAVLVHAHRTQTITWATVAELLTVTGVLTLTINSLDMVGAVAASVALFAGRIVGVAWLIQPTRATILRPSNPTSTLA
jgi:hypothetical protein